MHAQAVTRIRRTAVWAAVALTGLALLSACRPRADQADFGPTASRPPAAQQSTQSRCDVRTSVMSARNVIGLADVGATTGGRSVTDTDFSGCAAVSSLGWSCDLPFPWQTAAATGPAMATLGVRSARVATVITPARSVTETVLNSDIGVSGAKVRRELLRACPGKNAHTVVLASGPVVLALDFTEGTWSHAQKRRVLRAADAALARS